MKYLDIVLENCEFFKFRPEDVMEFSIKETEEYIREFANGSEKRKGFSGVHIRINKSANNPAKLIGYDDFYDYNDGRVFERILESNDITQLWFDKDDGGWVLWDGGDDFNNPGQHSYIDNEGHLVIDIK